MVNMRRVMSTAITRIENGGCKLQYATSVVGRLATSIIGLPANAWRSARILHVQAWTELITSAHDALQSACKRLAIHVIWRILTVSH